MPMGWVQKLKKKSDKNQWRNSFKGFEKAPKRMKEKNYSKRK